MTLQDVEKIPYTTNRYGEYGRYETLPEEVLNRFRYSECRNPLIVPVMFNKEHLEMMNLIKHA